jgi:uncharacterized coiled-coil DUF342 family protein
MNQISMDEATIAELRAQLKAVTDERDEWRKSDKAEFVKLAHDNEMRYLVVRDKHNALVGELKAMTEDRDVWATVAREMTEQRDVWQEVAGDMRRDANRLRAERNILLAALSPMPDAVRQKLDAIAEPK